VTSAILWQALCERGLVSDPLPIREGATVTRGQVGAPAGSSDGSTIELLARIILDRVLERSAAVLVGALI
jgi:hypothetical protein